MKHLGIFCICAIIAILFFIAGCNDACFKKTNIGDVLPTGAENTPILILTPDEAKGAIKKLMNENTDLEVTNIIDAIKSEYQEGYREIEGWEKNGKWFQYEDIETGEVTLSFDIIIDGWFCDLTVGAFCAKQGHRQCSGIFEKNENGEWTAMLIIK